MFYYDTPSLNYDSGPSVTYDHAAPTTKVKMARIKLETQRLGLPQFIQRCQRVSTMLTGNATFSSISAKVTAFTTALTTLTTADGAYQTAQQEADQKLTERDNARVEVENLYRQLAAASEGVTMEAAQLESGGWELRGVAAPVGDLPAPGNLSASYGDMAGEVDLQWDPVRGAVSYVGQCAPAATGPWTQVYQGTKSRFTHSDMTSGELCYFRVAGIGPNGPGAWSDIAEKRAA